MKPINKIFEIGFPKTASSSLGRAFEILGYRHKGWDRRLQEQVEAGDYDAALAVAANFDAFDDAPWHRLDFYKVLDAHFPGSKFILLDRDTDAWVESLRSHYSSDHNVNDIPEEYLMDNFDERIPGLIEWRETRTAEINEYFHDRPDELLSMNICAGDGWEKLCMFLGKPVPDVPFPHVNKSQRGAGHRLRTLLGRAHQFLESIRPGSPGA